jgi:hypothetical protein
VIPFLLPSSIDMRRFTIEARIASKQDVCRPSGQGSSRRVALRRVRPKLERRFATPGQIKRSCVKQAEPNKSLFRALLGVSRKKK